MSATHGRRPDPGIPAPEDLVATEPGGSGEAASRLGRDELPQGAAARVLAMVPVCGTARLLRIADDELEIVLGGEAVRAVRDPTVHPLVLEGALARGERVMAEHRVDEGWVVVGALRTQPVPGIDAAEEYTIEAERVRIQAGSELSLSARAASVVLRAVGEVETYADRILSRAEGLHKIVGRMLRLN